MSLCQEKDKCKVLSITGATNRRPGDTQPVRVRAAGTELSLQPWERSWKGPLGAGEAGCLQPQLAASLPPQVPEWSIWLSCARSPSAQKRR